MPREPATVIIDLATDPKWKTEIWKTEIWKTEILQNLPDAFINGRVVARTGEDLHDYVLFADRTRASEAFAGCLCRPLRALSDSIDRADIPIPNFPVSP
jgi:hypothetical protein